jgi:AcrR family transcriptional regulator
MLTAAPEALKPRKAPLQARSEVTVAAILEATIQVLLAAGSSERLTTTRVAERAGVSVGTVYQYFPHKRALLYAVLEQHLQVVTDAVDAACARARGKTFAEISDELTLSYLAAKTSRIEASQALYLVARELDTGDLLGSVHQRMRDALVPLFASASDAEFDDLTGLSFTFRAMLAGTVRAVLERGADRDRLELLQNELPVICRAYLTARAQPKAA